MQTLKFDLTKTYGKFKILNATNGGPWAKRHATDQYRTNMADYKAARIPYSRNHDSAVCGVYGGPYSHDISNIFPYFDADPYDPASYDFACTDEEILKCLEAGTKTFFRLGQTIEHQIKKHNTLPPKDFNKWAVICEHIIRHYTEGWADGFYHDMPYWEIWNEPDLDVDIPLKRTWGGTKEQFFDLYEITAKHLKKCFPKLKIGGPAVSRDSKEWVAEFVKTMGERNVPLDFFSWHFYSTDPPALASIADRIRKLLDDNGYTDTESILNEWNYIRGWEEDYIYSLKAMHGIKGAAYVMACISVAQPSTADMLMYYDTRPSVFNGVFDFYTYEKLKGYYPLYWYGMFYDLENEIRAENTAENIYSLCGVDKNGKITGIITHYCEDDSTKDTEIALDFGRSGKFEVYLLDENHDAEKIAETDELKFTLKNCSCLLIKEK